MLLFFLLSLAAHALALTPLVNKASYDKELLELYAKRAAAPKSAKLAVSVMDGQPFWTTTLSVNGRQVTMMIDTGSADLCVFYYLLYPNFVLYKSGR